MARKKAARRAKSERPGPAGFLVVDKPGGWTSHDVVDAARCWLGTRRVGDRGTRDPQATGVLPLAVRAASPGRHKWPYTSKVQGGPQSGRGSMTYGFTRSMFS